MRLLRLLLPFVLVAGCATIRAEHVLTGSPAAPYGGTVKLVMEGSPFDQDFDEVAIVSATGSGLDSSLSPVLTALQAEAARLGCDAVIRVRYDRGAQSATATGVGVRHH